MKIIGRDKKVSWKYSICLVLSAFAATIGSQEPTNFDSLEIVSFESSLELETSSETSANTSIGDINGDGYPDILLIKGRHWPLLDQILIGGSS